MKDHELWDFYKKHVASFWTAEEINLSNNEPHIAALPDDQMHFLVTVLGFFATNDKIVADNLGQNFMTEIMSLKAQYFYGFQLAMENVHSETYSLLIDTYVKDKHKRTDLFNSIETMPTAHSLLMASLT